MRDETLLNAALTVFDPRQMSRDPGSKGFTLEVMGEYETAIQTLLQAEPLVEQQDDSRLRYKLCFNLAVNACHLGRYAEAAERVQAVRALVEEKSDQVELTRVTWLEGRIAAGLGRTEEALRLLGQARQEFENRSMWYDVALALLEEAVLLLGRQALTGSARRPQSVEERAMPRGQRLTRLDSS